MKLTRDDLDWARADIIRKEQSLASNNGRRLTAEVRETQLAVFRERASFALVHILNQRDLQDIRRIAMVAIIRSAEPFYRSAAVESCGLTAVEADAWLCELDAEIESIWVTPAEAQPA